MLGRLTEQVLGSGGDVAMKENLLLRLPRVSLALLFEIVAAFGVWAAVLSNSYFRQGVLGFLLIATILTALSHLGYCYVFRHRLTPFIASHLFCFLWWVLYGGLLWSSDSASVRLDLIRMIVSGPFAYGINGWSGLISPVLLTTLTASALGLCFRPSLTTTHLFSLGSAYWYTFGFLQAVFAALGT